MGRRQDRHLEAVGVGLWSLPARTSSPSWISALRLPASWALDWADWRRAEKMITAGQIRFRNEGQRERMHMTLYEMLRGGRQ